MEPMAVSNKTVHYRGVVQHLGSNDKPYYTAAFKASAQLEEKPPPPLGEKISLFLMMYN